MALSREVGSGFWKKCSGRQVRMLCLGAQVMASAAGFSVAARVGQGREGAGTTTCGWPQRHRGGPRAPEIGVRSRQGCLHHDYVWPGDKASWGWGADACPAATSAPSGQTGPHAQTPFKADFVEKAPATQTCGHQDACGHALHCIGVRRVAA